MTPVPTTRASLLLRLRDSQDHEAWVEFVEIYEPAIYRQLRKCGLQDADTRELTQELFVAVNRHIATWEPAKERGSFRGWLRRVARNLVINWMKNGQRRMIALGGPESQSMFDGLKAEDCPESSEFIATRSANGGRDSDAENAIRDGGARRRSICVDSLHVARRQTACQSISRIRRKRVWPRLLRYG